jgi:hypothetical protein
MLDGVPGEGKEDMLKWIGDKYPDLVDAIQRVKVQATKPGESRLTVEQLLKEEVWE